MPYFHQPVLVQEVLKYLNPKPNQNFIDCTLGGGGHAQAILKKTGPNGRLLGLDRDPKAIKASTKKLLKYKNRITLIQGSYKNLPTLLMELRKTGTNKNKKYENRPTLHFNGILLDLGLSSAQVSPEESRGFSFQTDQALDMRFGPDTKLTAQEILNKWPEKKLIEIFKNYGEEPKARAIAKEVILFRERNPLLRTSQLTNLIEKISGSSKKRLNPATKVFQALRITVNQELEVLEESLPKLLDILPKGGRLAVISYHSLEDRIVKEFFKYESIDCHCPKEFPECRCNHKKKVKILTKKPVVPSEKEVEENPRSRSAKLRVVEKMLIDNR